MLKEIVLPPVDMENFSSQPIDTNLIIMSHDFNVNELVIPFYEANVFDTYEAFYSFQGNTSIIIQEVFNRNNEIRIPIVNEVRRHKGIFTIELNASSNSSQATLLKLNVMVKRSNIDSNSEFLFNHYYKLFEDYEKEIAELNNATQSTIKTQLKQSQDTLQKVTKTLIAVNDKVMVVNDTAEDFMLDVATKQADVTRKYNAFDTSVTQAGQTIDDILALQPQFQAVLDETTGKDVISAPEIILARDGEANLKARLDKNHNEVTAQLAQIAYNIDNELKDNDLSRAVEISFNNHDRLIVPKNEYVISRTIVIPPYKKIDFNDSTLIPSEDVDIIEIQGNGKAKRFNIETSGYVGFSKAQIKQTGKIRTNTISETQIKDFTLSGGRTGVGIHLLTESDGDSIVNSFFDNGKLRNLDRGILIEAKHSTSYINSNFFNRLSYFGCRVFIDLVGGSVSSGVDNNRFTENSIQPNSSSEIGIRIDGNRNLYSGNMWDLGHYPEMIPLEMIGNSRDNRVTSQIPFDRIIDNGLNSLNNRFNGLENNIFFRGYDRILSSDARRLLPNYLGEQDNILANATLTNNKITVTGKQPSNPLGNMFSLSPTSHTQWENVLDNEEIEVDIVLGDIMREGNVIGLMFPYNLTPKELKISVENSPGKFREVYSNNSFKDGFVYVANNLPQTIYSIKIYMRGSNNSNVRISSVFAGSSGNKGNSFLEKTGGSIYGNIDFQQGYAPIIRSPNGSRWLLRIRDTGELYVSEL